VVVVAVVVVGWLLIKSSIANGQNTKLGLLTTASCARGVTTSGSMWRLGGVMLIASSGESVVRVGLVRSLKTEARTGAALMDDCELK